jgi:hypothetical protein
MQNVRYEVVCAGNRASFQCTHVRRETALLGASSSALCNCDVGTGRRGATLQLSLSHGRKQTLEMALAHTAICLCMQLKPGQKQAASRQRKAAIGI